MIWGSPNSALPNKLYSFMNLGNTKRFWEYKVLEYELGSYIMYLFNIDFLCCTSRHIHKGSEANLLTSF